MHTVLHTLAQAADIDYDWRGTLHNIEARNNMAAGGNGMINPCRAEFILRNIEYH